MLSHPNSYTIVSYPALYYSYPTIYLLGEAMLDSTILYYYSILFYTILYFEASNVEVFDGKAWSSGDRMPPRHAHGVAVLNGYIYVVGGRNSNRTILRSVQRYHPTSGTYYTTILVLYYTRQYYTILFNTIL